MLAKRLTLALVSLGLVGLLVALPLLYQERYDERHAEIFDEMSVGSSRAKLVRLAGEPQYVTDGTRWVEPEYELDPSQRVPGCVAELWYHSWVALVPSRWAYCFDSRNQLVGKYHWHSW